jgi:AmiR/NasT family two-component response regulator
VLVLVRSVAAPLTPAALDRALSFADVATDAVLQGQQTAVSGQDGTALDAAFDDRFQLYQAQGMVMVQLGVDLEEAMARLRAYAYARGRPLGEVADDVVARRLTLTVDET